MSGPNKGIQVGVMMTCCPILRNLRTTWIPLLPAQSITGREDTSRLRWGAFFSINSYLSIEVHACILVSSHEQEAPYRTPLAEIFVQAGTELGFQNRDGNGEFQTGFMIAQGTTKNGRRFFRVDFTIDDSFWCVPLFYPRCSTSKAFLRPIRNRKNLHIALGSHVTKIVINEVTCVYLI